MSNDQKTNLPASVKSKLVNLAQKLDRDFNDLALEFALERLVIRLRSDPKLSKHMVFKGGFVMLKAYGSNRATVDLDTSIHGISIEEAESSARAVIERDIQDGLWLGFIESQQMDHQTEYTGLRLTIRYSFGEPTVDVRRLGKLILDVGTADAITPGPQDAVLKPLLGGEEIHWRIYPVETIVAEKLHALISHGSLNSRFKDVYDLTILLPKCVNSETLHLALSRCFEHRTTPLPKSFVEFWKALDKANLRRSQGAVEASVGEIPSFEVLEKRLALLLQTIS